MLGKVWPNCIANACRLLEMYLKKVLEELFRTRNIEAPGFHDLQKVQNMRTVKKIQPDDR